MKNPLKSTISTDLGLLLGRLPMGAFFVAAGCMKLKMGLGNFVVFAGKASHAPASVPHGLIIAYLHAVPFLEIAVGLLVVLGLLARLGGFIGALMVISFTIGYTGLWGQGPFTPNLIYLGILLMLLLAGPGRISLDRLLFRPQPATLPPRS